MRSPLRHGTGSTLVFSKVMASPSEFSSTGVNSPRTVIPDEKALFVLNVKVVLSWINVFS